MVADSAALLAAAVRAAVLAKAPRRTVSAVAAAVTSVLTAPATKDTVKRKPATQGAVVVGETMPGASPGELLTALRASRAAQRKRRKDRRRAAKVAAETDDPRRGSPNQTHDASAAPAVEAVAIGSDGAADERHGRGEPVVAESAQASSKQSEVGVISPTLPPPSASAMQLRDFTAGDGEDVSGDINMLGEDLFAGARGLESAPRGPESECSSLGPPRPLGSILRAPTADSSLGPKGRQKGERNKRDK